MALHEGDDVEHGLAFAPWHGIGAVSAVLAAAPQRNLQYAWHQASEVRASICKAALGQRFDLAANLSDEIV